jgi:hypothetical protein
MISALSVQLLHFVPCNVRKTIKHHNGMRRALIIGQIKNLSNIKPHETLIIITVDITEKHLSRIR